jgi:SAM-dependent methyltransferase
VYSINVLPRLLTLEDQRAALQEIARVIKPGGRLLFNYRIRPPSIDSSSRDTQLPRRIIIGKEFLTAHLDVQLDVRCTALDQVAIPLQKDACY